jgi:hypothetical protein
MYTINNDRLQRAKALIGATVIMIRETQLNAVTHGTLEAVEGGFPGPGHAFDEVEFIVNFGVFGKWRLRWDMLLLPGETEGVWIDGMLPTDPDSAEYFYDQIRFEVWDESMQESLQK